MDILRRQINGRLDRNVIFLKGQDIFNNPVKYPIGYLLNKPCLLCNANKLIRRNEAQDVTVPSNKRF